MFKRAKKIIGLGLVGLTLAYNIACGDYYDVEYKETPNNPPIIQTSSLPDAVVGEYYKKFIHFFDIEGDDLSINLVKGPEGMILEGKILKWSPRYGKEGGVFPYFSQTGPYDVIIRVSDGKEFTEKNLTLITNNNFNTYDFYFIKTNKNIREMSGDTIKIPGGNTHACPFNENTLDQKFEGMTSGIEELKRRTDHDVVSTLLPIEVHLVENVKGTWDGVCIADPSRYVGYQTTVTRKIEGVNIKKGLICLFKTVDEEGNISSGSLPVYDIKNQTTIIHEYTHLMFRDRVKINGRLEEPFAYGISNIITRLDLNSFCDISYGDYNLLFNLCNNYLNGFDVVDLPKFFDKVDIKREEKGSLLDEQDIKCIIDGIVKTNTWEAFDDAGIFVENNYCGD